MDTLTQIESRIRSLGYDSVLDFFVRNPGIPYGLLLKQIAEPVEGTNHLDFPILPLRELYRREAVQAGRAREFAKDGLIRSLRENLGKGWNTGRNAGQRRARAFSHWSTPSDDFEHLCDRVWEALVELNPPEDWRPEVRGDEYIEKAFEIAWPASIEDT